MLCQCCMKSENSWIAEIVALKFRKTMKLIVFMIVALNIYTTIKAHMSDEDLIVSNQLNIKLKV